MAFRGFPPEAISFYEGLEADNSKRPESRSSRSPSERSTLAG